MKILSAVHVSAPNDINGNPRRGWIVLTANHKYHFIDEEYNGTKALSEFGFTQAECQAIDLQSIPLNISASEYRRFFNK